MAPLGSQRCADYSVDNFKHAAQGSYMEERGLDFELRLGHAGQPIVAGLPRWMGAPASSCGALTPDGELQHRTRSSGWATEPGHRTASSG
eukprot:6778031-Alexandrium_andersonii.AAC.1